MKQQTKLIGILVILIALLAGAFVLYQNLSKKYKADTASEETSSVNDTKEQGYTFPVYYDTEQEAAYNYQAESLPTTYFINQDGEIVSGARGAMEESALEAQIKKLIK